MARVRPICSRQPAAGTHHFHRLRAVAEQQGTGAEEELDVLVLWYEHVDVALLAHESSSGSNANINTNDDDTGAEG